MKRIMFFIWSLNMGGSEKACVRIANELCKKYDVTIHTFFGGGILRTELSSDVNVINTFPFFIRGLSRLVGILPPKICYRLFVRGDYDVEIAVGDGLESHVLSGSANHNLFSWVHMDVRYHGDSPSKKTYKRFSSFRKIICVSNVTSKAFTSVYGFSDKVITSYTPIDFEIIKKKSYESSIYICPNSLISIGRLEKVKGYDRLICAVEKCKSHFHLYICGNGTQYENLTKLIVQKGLEDKIHLLGEVRNPYPLLRHSSGFICSSENESFGLAVLEAMSLQVPVIATKCGGTEEIIEQPSQGLLVENSISGLIDGIDSFFKKQHNIDVDIAYVRAMDFCLQNTINSFIDILEEKYD